jgi:hypothetical protein
VEECGAPVTTSVLFDGNIPTLELDRNMWARPLYTARHDKARVELLVSFGGEVEVRMAESPLLGEPNDRHLHRET